MSGEVQYRVVVRKDKEESVYAFFMTPEHFELFVAKVTASVDNGSSVRFVHQDGSGPHAPVSYILYAPGTVERVEFSQVAYEEPYPPVKLLNDSVPLNAASAAKQAIDEYEEPYPPVKLRVASDRRVQR